MHDRSSRRTFLQGLLASTTVIGFDVISRAWVTAANAQSSANLAEPVGTVPMTPADWKQHFQPVWGKLLSSKQRFDPDKILAPGQGIFV